MGTITKTDAAALGVVKLAADEASPIETTRMGGCSLLLPWKRYEVQPIRIEGSGSCATLTDDDTASHAPTTFGDLLECLDIVRRISEIPHGTPRPRSSHLRLGTRKRQSNTIIPGLAPYADPDLLSFLIVKSVELVCIHPSILPPQLITIYKSDLDEEMAMVPAPAEDSRGNLVLLMSYLCEMQYVYQFWYLSAISWFQ
jgi:hypothetical protein